MSAIADLWPALPWASTLLVLPLFLIRRPRLRRPSTPPKDFVSIIVPARNEQANIEILLTSLTQSSYSRFEVVVVDDESTDDTAEIVERIAGTDSRIRLLRGAPLPHGWFGKPWACVQGFRAARGSILLFTDADTQHHPAFLGAVVASLRTTESGALSILSDQVCLTFWERIVMPQVWVLLGLRYHPWVVNRARQPRDTIANGQCLLLTREVYERVGTHEVVRGEVAEDLALAQHLLQAGHRVRLLYPAGMIRTRMYRSLPELIEGWSKNIFLGGRRSFPDNAILRNVVPLLLPLPVLFWVIPPALALMGIGWTPAALVFSVLFWTGIVVSMHIPWYYGLGYPVGGLMLLAILLRSIVRGGRRVEWRGRTYNVTGLPPEDQGQRL